MPTVALQSDPLHTLGDPDAWVELYGDALLRFALTRGVERATAEDLVQETLIAAWRSRDSFEGGCEPLTWMTSILRRRVSDHYRREGRRAPTTEVPDEEIVCGASERVPGPEDAEFWSVVTGCTGQLPEHLARAFRLRTFADADPGEICESEGISRKNLSVRLHRARRMLRRCLEMKWFTDDPNPGAVG